MDIERGADTSVIFGHLSDAQRTGQEAVILPITPDSEFYGPPIPKPGGSGSMKPPVITAVGAPGDKDPDEPEEIVLDAHSKELLDRARQLINPSSP